MTRYEGLPTADGDRAQSRQRWRFVAKDARALARYAFIGCLAVPIAHFTFLGLAPESEYAKWYRPQGKLGGSSHAPLLTGHAPAYYRDTHPFRTINQFWQQAVEEVRSSGLDTCADQLGATLIEAYARTRFDYCKPYSAGGSFITCTAVKHDEKSEWWPVPAAPCISNNLRGNEQMWTKQGCNVTEQGLELDEEMTHERFIGTNLGSSHPECDERVERMLLVIPRQDQWNPFHVGEDMVTTVVTSLIAVAAEPSLADRPVQLVFQDDYALEANHFVPMWDKIGAWPPRRLSLDPWRNACFGTVVHSVKAGVSLLSALGVGEGHNCASSITWAASHYYRHLFGLTPSKRGVNVLWLSRAKFDDWAQRENQWGSWRAARHLENEQDLVDRIRQGLSGMCSDCFVDEDESPGNWSNSDGLRFATIDPSVHSLDAQVHLVGHTNILLSMHGGAMGLMLFMPPGQGSVIEMTVIETAASKHFDTMSHQLGHWYERLEVERWVDVDQVWRTLEPHVRAQLH